RLLTTSAFTPPRWAAGSPTHHPAPTAMTDTTTANSPLRERRVAEYRGPHGAQNPTTRKETVMADDPHEQHTRTPRPDTDRAPRRDTGGVEVEAVDHLTRHDPSAPSRAGSRGRRWPTGEVAWVRVSDVMTHRSGQVAGRGITWTATMNRWP